MADVLTNQLSHSQYEDMDLSRLTIRQLEIIASIINLKSVSGAASALNLSQSNVSHTLARARVLLEDPLVFLEQGKMEPSQKALGLVSRVNEIIKLASFDCETQSSTIDGLSKTIRIYCTSEFVESHGTAIVSALRDEGYKGPLYFPRSTEKSLERLEQDPLAFLVRPTAILPPAMVQRKISEETWTLVCSENHPVRQNREFGFANALEHEFVVVRPYEGFPSSLDVAAAMRGEKRRVCAFVTQYHEMIPFILSGKCIGIVPSSVAHSLSKIYPICGEGIYKMNELPPFTVSLAWYPKFTHNALSAAVRTTILSLLIHEKEELAAL